MDNQTATKHLSKGTDATAAAPYLRHKRMLKVKVYRGLIWFYFLHGQHNAADVLTKQVRSTSEFKSKGDIISGCVPQVFETENMPRFLLNNK